MVGKMANVLWIEGSFVETLKGWQSGWFYITEPRDPEWVAAPEFRSGPPTRLTSWKETGLSWGKKGELTGLQTCVQTLVDKKLKLVNVVQVMLIRLILPCQQRAFNLWEFDPARHQTKMPGRCFSRAPRPPHPLPRIADSVHSVTLMR